MLVLFSAAEVNVVVISLVVSWRLVWLCWFELQGLKSCWQSCFLLALFGFPLVWIGVSDLSNVNRIYGLNIGYTADCWLVLADHLTFLDGVSRCPLNIDMTNIRARVWPSIIKPAATILLYKTVFQLICSCQSLIDFSAVATQLKSKMKRSL